MLFPFTDSEIICVISTVIINWVHRKLHLIYYLLLLNLDRFTELLFIQIFLVVLTKEYCKENKWYWYWFFISWHCFFFSSFFFFSQLAKNRLRWTSLLKAMIFYARNGSRKTQISSLYPTKKKIQSILVNTMTKTYHWP